MNTYQLVFSDDGLGEPRKIEFEATDPNTALSIGHRTAPERAAQLWRGHEMLCSVSRSLLGFCKLS